MPDRAQSLSFVAVLVSHYGHIALAVAEPSRWLLRDGYTFIPATLPGGPAGSADRPDDLADRFCREAFGRPATARASSRLYGPSLDHTIDELTTAGEGEPLPVLRFTRMLPLEPGENRPRLVMVRVYLADVPGFSPGNENAAPVLWLTPRSMRNALRGMPLGDLLAQRGARLDQASSHGLPDNAFVFIPAEYGERYLVRVAAKYGPESLFQSLDAGGAQGA